MKTEEIFISNESIAIELIRKHSYPHEILKEIKDYIITIGNKLDNNYLKQDENIWIHKSAKVETTAKIIGPCIIDENAEIRHCAFIRGGVIIGKNTVLGNSCEIKNSILFDNVQVPHFNYIGDSILGTHAHMGAGSITSNVKSDRKPVRIKENNKIIETNLKKVGAFLGDNVEVGCNSVLNPGTIIGPNTNIYSLTSVRGVIPKNSIVKSTNNIIRKEEI